MRLRGSEPVGAAIGRRQYEEGDQLPVACRDKQCVKRNMGNTWGIDMGYSFRMVRLQIEPVSASMAAIWKLR